MRKVIQIQAGPLMRGTVRTLLTQEQFIGSGIEWTETGRWLTRTFLVKGPKEDMDRLKVRLATMGSEIKEIQKTDSGG